MIIDVEVEITSDKKFVRGSSSRCEKSLDLIKEYGQFLRMDRRRWTAIDVEDC
jgi:hypothetical protein